jgi:phage antirepressor YoqD-like protein
LEVTTTRAAAAEHQVLELAPAAHAWDELAEATGDYSVREAAQILDRDPSIQTGQKRLFDYLRSIGWLDRHNQPYQRHMDCGRLTVRARSYEHPHRDELVATQQVRITTKGLGELHRMLGGGAQFQALMSEEIAA